MCTSIVYPPSVSIDTTRTFNVRPSFNEAMQVRRYVRRSGRYRRRRARTYVTEPIIDRDRRNGTSSPTPARPAGRPAANERRRQPIRARFRNRFEFSDLSMFEWNGTTKGSPIATQGRRAGFRRLDRRIAPPELPLPCLQCGACVPARRTGPDRQTELHRSDPSVRPSDGRSV